MRTAEKAREESFAAGERMRVRASLFNEKICNTGAFEVLLQILFDEIEDAVQAGSLSVVLWYPLYDMNKTKNVDLATMSNLASALSELGFNTDFKPGHPWSIDWASAEKQHNP